ncbi:MAG: hypothetical protein LBH43_00085 [Treponema sp.]|jgi:hypothetical protein|nr:hypothetical protein [Treponema sp.]
MAKGKKILLITKGHAKLKFCIWFSRVLPVLMLLPIIFACASTAVSIQPAKSSAPPKSAAAADIAVEGISWTFQDRNNGTGGWYLAYDEFYAYKGPAALSWDNSTFGRGMLKLDLDYSANSKSDWSEVKIKNILAEPVVLKNVSVFSFDCYINPALYTGGQFKAKVFSEKGIDVDLICDMIDAVDDAGKGFLKAAVSIALPSNLHGTMEEMYLSIAGYYIDYKGPLFLDNLRWE